MSYTKDQVEEKIKFYTDKIEYFRVKSPKNLHNISVYENLLKFWTGQLSKIN